MRLRDRLEQLRCPRLVVPAGHLALPKLEHNVGKGPFCVSLMTLATPSSRASEMTQASRLSRISQVHGVAGALHGVATRSRGFTKPSKMFPRLPLVDPPMSCLCTSTSSVRQRCGCAVDEHEFGPGGRHHDVTKTALAELRPLPCGFQWQCRTTSYGRLLA